MVTPAKRNMLSRRRAAVCAAHAVRLLGGQGRGRRSRRGDRSRNSAKAIRRTTSSSRTRPSRPDPEQAGGDALRRRRRRSAAKSCSSSSSATSARRSPTSARRSSSSRPTCRRCWKRCASMIERRHSATIATSARPPRSFLKHAQETINPSAHRGRRARDADPAHPDRRNLRARFSTTPIFTSENNVARELYKLESDVLHRQRQVRRR